ncbi:hypothetical protein [Flavobacterium sp.]|uniref:hypothetical protein n=1 Tax=Flavobacterium sp. TaxID=239 RepID=UPI00374D274E
MKNSILTKAILISVSLFILTSINPVFSQRTVIECKKNKEKVTLKNGATATLKVGRPWYAWITGVVIFDRLRIDVTVKSAKKKSRWYLLGIKTRTKAKANIDISTTVVAKLPGDGTIIADKWISSCENVSSCTQSQNYVNIGVIFGGKPGFYTIKGDIKGFSSIAIVSVEGETVYLCSKWGKKVPNQ